MYTALKEYEFYPGLSFGDRRGGQIGIALLGLPSSVQESIINPPEAQYSISHIRQDSMSQARASHCIFLQLLTEKDNSLCGAPHSHG